MTSTTIEYYEYTYGQVTRPGYVVLDGEEGERSFNELGAQGWEMYAPNGTVAYFKRRVADPNVPVLETKVVDFPPPNPRLGSKQRRTR